VFDTEDLKTQPGPRLVELVGHRISEMAGRPSPAYPAAMKCLLADREGLTAYLRFPAEHHHRIRHSNFIERTFDGTRRRTKVIGRLPGEVSCLTLVWAVLDRASRGWHGLTMTAAGLRLLQDLRRSLLDPPRQFGHIPSPLPATMTAPRMSVPSPSIVMKPDRARRSRTGFRSR
jgi:putative transposase